MTKIFDGVVTNILGLASDGYFSQEFFHPLFDVPGEECVDTCICYEIVSNLSYAVAAFERITFTQRRQLPDTYWASSGMGNWQTESWFPDKLAKKAKFCRNDSVDLSEIGKDRWVEFAVKNKYVENGELHSVTFAYPWWPETQRT